MGLIVKELPIRGDVGSAKAQVLFDTGASMSFVRKGLASKVATVLKAPELMTFQLGDGQGTLEAGEEAILRVTINGCEIVDNFMVVDHLADDVIIGAQTLQKWRIKLDMEHEEVIIDPKVTQMRLVSMTAVPHADDPALVTERKTNAARLFVERLLRRSPEGIAKIILFGSVAEGRAHKDSDVDLLIFGLGDLAPLSETVIDVAFETSLETGESVEPVVLPAWRCFQPGGLFVPHVLCRGKELFTMPESDLERAERQGLKSLAESYLQVAEQVFQNGHHRQAADMAYNAAELITKALLIGKVDHLPTTHSGIVNLFGQHLVQPGLVPRELGREINAGLFIRNRARYEHTAQVSEAEAERVLRLAKRLLDEIKTV